MTRADIEYAEVTATHLIVEVGGRRFMRARGPLLGGVVVGGTSAARDKAARLALKADVDAFLNPAPRVTDDALADALVAGT